MSKNYNRKDRDDTNLIGRQVYFKMSKKTYLDNEDNISKIIPNKLYTIVSFDTLNLIKNDKGNLVTILFNPMVSGHLNNLTGWTLKRESNKEKLTNV